MDIKVGNPTAIINNRSSIPPVISPTDRSGIIPIAVVKPEAVKSESINNQWQLLDKESNKLTRNDISQITVGLNKFVKTINADLHFTIHEKTQRMMVQVVNTKDQSIIKEFPVHELLDTLAAISDYVGILLDKKV